MTDNLNRAVLVLNGSWEPINVTSAKRALKLVCKGHAVVQDASTEFIRAGKIRLPVPSVIRLLTYRSVPRIARSVSRKSIMVRDSNTCQYCASVFPSGRLTLDHVIPRARGGRNSWENLVSCCRPCNNRKGSRTPGEAGMVLLRQPRAFGTHAKYRQLAVDNQAWKQFLFS